MLSALLWVCLIGAPDLDLPPAPAPTDAAAPVRDPNADDAAWAQLGVGRVPDALLVRGLQDIRLQQPGTVLGSYGQFNLEYVGEKLTGPMQGIANLKRLVLFVSHHFTDSVRGYVEFEWENAVACASCSGAAEVEQAFVDWELCPHLNLRSGVILVPFGIINQWHEPPVFNGVNRPNVETLIIPTTWRELGIGITGRVAETWRYEAYLMTTPDVTRLGAQGLRRATTEASLTPANTFMLAGRLEAEPLLGWVVGASLLAGDLRDGSRVFASENKPLGAHVPLIGAGIDARWRRNGVEARVLYASFWLPNAGALMQADGADGGPLFNPDVTGAIPTRMFGTYAELGYDLLRLFKDSPQQLVPFGRIEYYDTQAAVPQGFTANRALATLEYTVGISYRPMQQLVFKGDTQLASHRRGPPQARLNLGLGYMF